MIVCVFLLLFPPDGSGIRVGAGATVFIPQRPHTDQRPVPSSSVAETIREQKSGLSLSTCTLGILDPYLVIRGHTDCACMMPPGCQGSMSVEEALEMDQSIATCVLAMVDEEAIQTTECPSMPMLNRRRCRIEARATLIVAHQQSVQHWQQALDAASGPSRLNVLVIANQRKMRSLTVAEALSAHACLKFCIKSCQITCQCRLSRLT